MIDKREFAFAAARTPSRIIGARPAPRSENGKINPHVTRFFLADGRASDLFHVKPVYYEAKDGTWRPLAEIAAHHGNRRIVLLPKAIDQASWRFLSWMMKRQRLLGRELQFGYPGSVYSGVRPLDFARMETLTAYPDPNPETTTVDGYVQNTDVDWATAHGATSGSVVDDSSAGSRASSITNGQRRAFTLFDTSSMPDDATISSAVASLYVTAKTNDDNDGDDWLNVVQSSPASNTALALGDFDQCGSISNPTEGSTRIDIGSISTSAYNDWSLNATGIGWVTTSGITKLGWREGHDAINSAAVAISDVSFSAAEAGGTTQDPKLVVTYTAPLGTFMF